MTDVIITVVKAVGDVSTVEISGVEQVEFMGHQIYIEGRDGMGHHFSLDEVDTITLGHVMAVDMVYYETTIRVENVSEVWLSASDLVTMDTLWITDGGGKMVGKYPLEGLLAVDFRDPKQVFLQDVEQEGETEMTDQMKQIIDRLDEIRFEMWMEEQKDFVDWFKYFDLEREKKDLEKQFTEQLTVDWGLE